MRTLSTSSQHEFVEDDNASAKTARVSLMHDVLSAVHCRTARRFEAVVRRQRQMPDDRIGIDFHLLRLIVDGTVVFTDGRHRFAWLRDHGLRALSVEVGKATVDACLAGRGLLVDVHAELTHLRQ
ncbi:hypothetical protein [Burkholderia cepacia]|nr:hypothetical protein [Burkholderia cepacia]